MAANELFRKEALDALDADRNGKGELLHLTPRWLGRAYPLLVCAVAGSLSFASVASVGEFATGPAVVRIDHRVELTATATGTVESLVVTPGQHVEAGALLVRFNVAQESAELARLQSEFDGQLLRLLRDPSDQSARQALTSLRAARQLAAAHVAQRAVRAPSAGIVSDVRIRPGELLQAGDHVLSIVGEGARFSVVALLPGQYRPLLHPGQTLRLSLNGFPHASELVTIDSVGDEIVGADEARRYLGPAVGEALTISGPVVVVKGSLSRASFAVDKKQLSFYDGLPGRAEARVRAQSLITFLVPALRWVVSDGS